MSEPNRYLHYKVLGRKLKLLREKLDESLDEVSGAVEIEASVLERIEKGEQQPSEDILLLLLSHFDPQDDEAVSLWELAGYDQDDMPEDDSSDETPTSKPVFMLVAPENRIVYTDQVDINANKYGVVLNFMQHQGTDAPQNVSKVGMSREHAHSLMMALHRSLTQNQAATPKFLPAPRKPKKD